MKIAAVDKKSYSTNFGMALTIKDRAINNTAIFPNAHSDVIRKAVTRGMNTLERLARDVDITIDVEPAYRGFDWKGEHGLLSVTVRKPDPARGKDQITRLISAVKRTFTEPSSYVEVEAESLRKTARPEELLIKIVTDTKKKL